MIRSFFNVIPLTRNDIIQFKYSQSMRVSLNGMQGICVYHLAHRESALYSYNSILCRKCMRNEMAMQSVLNWR